MIKLESLINNWTVQIKKIILVEIFQLPYDSLCIDLQEVSNIS
jgi:hypothetical protein